MQLLLGDWARQHNIQGAALVRQLEGKVARRAVYHALQGKGVQLETLGLIVKGLEDLSGKTIEPNDVIRFS